MLGTQKPATGHGVTTPSWVTDLDAIAGRSCLDPIDELLAIAGQQQVPGLLEWLPLLLDLGQDPDELERQIRGSKLSASDINTLLDLAPTLQKKRLLDCLDAITSTKPAHNIREAVSAARRSLPRTAHSETSLRKTIHEAARKILQRVPGYLRTARFPPFQDPLASAQDFLKKTHGITGKIDLVNPVAGGPGLLFQENAKGELCCVEVWPASKREYASLGLWLVLQHSLEKVLKNKGASSWAGLQQLWTLPFDTVHYYARFSPTRALWTGGELARLATSLNDSASLNLFGAKQPTIKLYSLNLRKQSPKSVSLGNVVRDDADWSSVASTLPTTPRPKQLERLRNDVGVGVSGRTRWVSDGKDVALSLPGKLAREVSGTLEVGSKSMSYADATKAFSDAREPVRVSAIQLDKGKQPEYIPINEMARTWTNYLVWPPTPDERELPASNEKPPPVPDNWQIWPEVDNDRNIFTVNRPMHSKWQLVVNVLLRRLATKNKRTLAEFVDGSWTTVAGKSSKGSNYPLIARLIRLANARSFLNDKPLVRPGKGKQKAEKYQLEALALLPDRKPDDATKTYGALVGIAALAGVKATPNRLGLVFGAKNLDHRTSRPRMITRLGVLLSRVLHAGYLHNSQQVAGWSPRRLEEFTRDFTTPRKEQVFSKTSLKDMSAKQTMGAVTAEIMIDACLYLLKQQPGSLTPPPSTGTTGAAPPPSTGTTGAAPPPSTGTTGAAPPPSTGTTGAAPHSSTGTMGAAGPSNTSTTDGAAPYSVETSPSATSPGGMTGDDQGTGSDLEDIVEIDSVDDAIGTLWDVFKDPPKGNDPQGEGEGGDLETPNDFPDHPPEPWPPEVPAQEVTNDFICGSYCHFHNGVLDWGIRIDAARTFGRVAQVFAQWEDAGSPAKLPAGMAHPLHALAVAVLATVFHEWHHHLEELAFTDLELNGVPAAQWWSSRWYADLQTTNANFNEGLAEADAFDQLLWLMNVEKPRKGRREIRHWRDQQLRRYGLHGPDEPSIGGSVEAAIKTCEEESRANGYPQYAKFDKYRRVEPRWGFVRLKGGLLPSQPPTKTDSRTGPAMTPSSVYWAGIEKHMTAVGTYANSNGAAWPTYPPGGLAAIFEGAAEKYAPSYDSKVPVRFSSAEPWGPKLLKAVAVLAQAHNKSPWAKP